MVMTIASSFASIASFITGGADHASHPRSPETPCPPAIVIRSILSRDRQALLPA
jgi:hypothetical protein